MSTPKPPSPPPAYTEFEPTLHASSSRPLAVSPHHHNHHHSGHQHGFNSPPIPAFPVHPHYGPTPLLSHQHTQILPYYDPRSPYAVAEANSRARWRFLGAFFWALVILFTLSVVCSIEVEIQRQPWRGWRFGHSGNSDPWMDR